jgi:hypothetical protein
MEGPLNKKLHCLLLTVLLAGCATPQNTPLTMSQANQIRGKSLVAVAHEKPSFAAATATKAMFGGFGALAMISEGDQIVKANNIEDPSIYIGEEIAKSLADRFDLSTSTTPDISDTADLNGLAGRHAESDLVLFTQTRGWGFTYFPADWDNYRVTLNVTMRLIDTRQKSVLAAGDCAYSPEYADSNAAPGHDDLLADDAAGLKAELRKGADYCLQKFLKETLA